MPGVGHLLPIRHGQLHVHGRHGNGAGSDPPGEPGGESDEAARVEVEEATRYLPIAGILGSSDELGVGRT